MEQAQWYVRSGVEPTSRFREWGFQEHGKEEHGKDIVSLQAAAGRFGPKDEPVVDFEIRVLDTYLAERVRSQEESDNYNGPIFIGMDADELKVVFDELGLGAKRPHYREAEKQLLENYQSKLARVLG